MQFLKRFLEKQKEIFKKYFENTPIYLAVKNLVIPIILGVGGWCSRSFQNPYILIYVLLFVILIFAISMYYMSSHYVNMKELYFDKDVFLIDMLTHIEKVKHLKKTKDINHVNVSHLTVNFSINKTNEPAQSDLNVTWNVDCIVVDKEISDYYMIYSKSDSKRKANPIATIKSENEDYVAKIKEMNTGIYNCFLAGLQPGKLPVNRYFHATIELNNYYRFVWEDYDTLMVNTNLYGKSVDKIDIVLTCDDIRISNAIISIYEVNPDNLHKKFIQHLKYTNENGIHTFSFSSNKIKPKCLYLILIPKCE